MFLLWIEIVLLWVGVVCFWILVGEVVFIVFFLFGDGFLGLIMCIFDVFDGVFIAVDGVVNFGIFIGVVLRRFFLVVNGVLIWFDVILEVGFGLEVGVIIFWVGAILGFWVLIVEIVWLIDVCWGWLIFWVVVE